MRQIEAQHKAMMSEYVRQFGVVVTNLSHPVDVSLLRQYFEFCGPIDTLAVDEYPSPSPFPCPP